MAKKKQLAGKQTKLAKLPLTQALAQQLGGGDPWPPPQRVSDTPETRQLTLTWEAAEEGAAGPMAYAFIQVVRDLALLQSELPPPSGPPQVFPPLPETIPPSSKLRLALSQARQDLQGLKTLLS